MVDPGGGPGGVLQRRVAQHRDRGRRKQGPRRKRGLRRWGSGWRLVPEPLVSEGRGAENKKCITDSKLYSSIYTITRC